MLLIGNNTGLSGFIDIGNAGIGRSQINAKNDWLLLFHVFRIEPPSLSLQITSGYIWLRLRLHFNFSKRREPCRGERRDSFPVLFLFLRWKEQSTSYDSHWQ